MLIQPPQRIAIRQKLLECFQNETLAQVRHKIGDGIAEVARQYSDDGRWTDFDPLDRMVEESG